MKHLLLIGLIGLSIQSYAQLDTLKQIDGDYQIKDIVEIPANKNDLFKRSKLYFVDAFKSANNVIQYEDAAEGKIIGKGFFRVEEIKDSMFGWYQVYWDVNYSTEITCKDGKYRYRMYDIIIDQAGKGNTTYIPNGSFNIAQLNEHLKKKEKVNQIYTKLYSQMNERFNSSKKQIDTYLKTEKTDGF